MMEVLVWESPTISDLLNCNSDALLVALPCRESLMYLVLSQGRVEASRPIHVVVSLGTGRVPVKAVDVCDVYRPEGIFDVAKVVFGAKNLAELFVDQVGTRFTDLCLSLTLSL